MPSTRATSSAKRASHRRSGTRILRLLAWSGAASVVAFAVVLLAIRFIVFPQVESQRERIAAMLSEQLGQPVEIGAIATGWDGWNPKLILTNFRVRDRLEASETPLVELPEVDVTLAWTSLPLMQLRLKQLVIERPRLAIRRDRGGLLHVAGLEFDPAQQTDDSTLTDWLLKQRRIIVRDALITWNDDLRNAPQLVLDRVQFRLENEAFGRHRIGLTGTPPAELAAPIDIRVEVAGAPLREWQRTEGRAYVRLDYADVGAWREWLPLPVPVDRGKGALRLWFDFGGGRITGLTADVELADVRTRLAEGLPELEMPHLSGRMGWKDEGGERELAFRHLAFTTASGVEQPPVDFALRLSLPGGDRAAGGELSFDRVELEPLRTLAAQLPLPERLRIDLARLAPQGALTRDAAALGRRLGRALGLCADQRVRAARRCAAGGRARRARRVRHRRSHAGRRHAATRQPQRGDRPAPAASRSRSGSTPSTPKSAGPAMRRAPRCGWTSSRSRIRTRPEAPGESGVRCRRDPGRSTSPRRFPGPTSANCTRTCRGGCRRRPATGCVSGCCREPARTPAWCSRATSRSSRSPAARTGSSWSRSRRGAST